LKLNMQTEIPATSACVTDKLNFQFFDKSNEQSIQFETAVTWSKSN